MLLVQRSLFLEADTRQSLKDNIVVTDELGSGI
jgi:hypothetical protein